MKRAIRILLMTVALGATPMLGSAQNPPPDDLDPEKLALTYYKVAGKAFDFDPIANLSAPVQSATSFDKPDVMRKEVARMHAVQDQATDKTEFSVAVANSITDYDHAHGEFSVALFEAGSYLPVYFNKHEYRVVFANAERARAIPMPDKEQARAFDQELLRHSRAVTTNIRFRVIGAGDPAGAVSGEDVVRAELLSAQTVDRDGKVLTTANLSGAPAAAPAQFSAAALDVAGLRIGVKVNELQAAIERLYGKPTRTERGKSADYDERFAGYLELDLMRCLDIPGGHRHVPQPGDICLRAFYDSDEIVRSILIQRVFATVDTEVVRRAALNRYGPASTVENAGTGYVLGWGPTLDRKLVSYGGRSGYPLTLSIDGSVEFPGAGRSHGAKYVIALQLVDNTWAGGPGEHQ